MSYNRNADRKRRLRPRREAQAKALDAKWWAASDALRAAGAASPDKASWLLSDSEMELHRAYWKAWRAWRAVDKALSEARQVLR